MWAIGLLGFGVAASAAGSFVGAGIMRGSRALQPTNPAALVAAVSTGCVAALAGVIGGFFLFGWWWLAALAALLLLGFGVAIDALKSAGNDRLPGVAILAVLAGVLAQGLAVFIV